MKIENSFKVVDKNSLAREKLMVVVKHFFFNIALLSRKVGQE